MTLLGQSTSQLPDVGKSEIKRGSESEESEGLKRGDERRGEMDREESL